MIHRSLGRDSRLCICNNLPGEANAAGCDHSLSNSITDAPYFTKWVSAHKNIMFLCNIFPKSSKCFSIYWLPAVWTLLKTKDYLTQVKPSMVLTPNGRKSKYYLLLHLFHEYISIYTKRDTGNRCTWFLTPWSL